MEAPSQKRAEKAPAIETKPRAQPSAKPFVKHTATRLPAPDEPATPKLDPSLVPVAEDFRATVEQRIDKRSNLELELERVAREVTKRQ
jgi:hypothetical protein